MSNKKNEDNNSDDRQFYSVAALVTNRNETFKLHNGVVYATSKEEAKGLFFDMVIEDYDGNYTVADLAAMKVVI